MITTGWMYYVYIIHSIQYNTSHSQLLLIIVDYSLSPSSSPPSLLLLLLIIFLIFLLLLLIRYYSICLCCYSSRKKIFSRNRIRIKYCPRTFCRPAAHGRLVEGGDRRSVCLHGPPLSVLLCYHLPGFLKSNTDLLVSSDCPLHIPGYTVSLSR